MYDIYLVETLKTYLATPIITSTNDIQVSLNTIVIKNINRFSVIRGQLLEISGKKYTISKIGYNDLYKYYTFTVIGSPITGFFSAVQWKVYNYNSTTNSVKLDADALEITTDFKITDYSDIGSKKDIITKPITLKGTAVNNAAFGNLFYLTKHTDLGIANTIAFNYTPVRSVDCLVFENGMLQLKGNLIVADIKVSEAGSILYNCIITGKLIQISTLLGDSQLTDLDLKAFEHVYDIDAVKNSWKGYNPTGTYSIGNSTYKVKDPITGTITSKTAAYGKGYIYPFIDYGERFSGSQYNLSYNYYKAQNFRPALYLREYFNKIFSSIDFTYEIKGSPEFIDLFDRLFIPNVEENNYSEQLGVKGHLTYSGVAFPLVSDGGIGDGGWNPVHYVDGDAPRWINPVVWNTEVQTNLIDRDTILFPNVQPFGSYSVPVNQRENQVIIINRNFNSTCSVNVTGTYQNYNSVFTDTKFWVQLCRRNRQTGDDSTDDFASWEVLAEKEYASTYNVNTSFNATLTVDYRSYNQGEQLMVRMLRKEENTHFRITMNSAYIKFSKDATTPYNVETSTGDLIKPIAPANIKQIDLITSVARQFNMFIYTEKQDPKKVIFQTYDDYYALTEGTNLKQTALDWTKKVAKGFTKKSNITIPKKYSFGMKADSDYLNDSYNKTYGEVIGTMKFNDSYGFTDERKIETIFSPTITAQIGSNRFTPFITKNDVTLAGKEKMKSNIRLMYYSGVHLCDPYTIGQDLWNGSFWGAFFWAYQLEYYPLCSNYAYSANSNIFNNPVTAGIPTVPKPVSDINFNIPNEFRFTPTDDYYKVTTSFDYYVNQVKELTNPDLYILEMNMFLNDADIANLKLSRPIFIDVQEYGACYYKVQQVEYRGSGKVSKVVLQRIVM